MIERGKVIFVGGVRRGVSTRTGQQWCSQQFAIETIERSPRKICFQLFGEDKISAAKLKEGEEVTISAWAESHEYNGNWFTELRVADVLDGQMSRFNLKLSL